MVKINGIEYAHIWIDPDVKDKLKAKAASAKMSMKDYVKFLIENTNI